MPKGFPLRRSVNQNQPGDARKRRAQKSCVNRAPEKAPSCIGIGQRRQTIDQPRLGLADDVVQMLSGIGVKDVYQYSKSLQDSGHRRGPNCV